jgi:succinate dehydrogenase/fumarate reductase flavoprotein subunit
MGLGKGLSRLEGLNYILYSKGRCEDDFVIQNMLTVAKLVTSAALKRDKSIGAHYRSDSVG